MFLTMVEDSEQLVSYSVEYTAIKAAPPSIGNSFTIFDMSGLYIQCMPQKISET